jgi:predicted phage-related endonuclease
MGNAIAFDTHVYVKKLKAAGFTEEQAEILASTQADLIDERLATKQDLKESETALKRDIKELEVSLKRDMKELETALKRDIKELEVRLESKIVEQKSETIKWVAGMLIGQALLIIGMLKFL